MSDYSRSELRKQREEKARREKRRLFAIIGVALALVCVVIIAVVVIKNVGKGSKGKKDDSSESSQVQKVDLSFSAPIEVRSVKGTVSLAWASIDGAVKYNILRRDVESEEPAVVGTIDAAAGDVQEYTDETVVKHQEYVYSIMALSEDESTGVSDEISVYVLPKNPKCAIIGECYVVGIDEWALDLFPKGSIALGTEGATTYKLLNESNFVYDGANVTAIERAALDKPDVVYFLVGMNEAANGAPEETIANFEQITTNLKSVNSHIKIVLLAISPTGKTSTLNVPKLNKRKKFNAAYEQFASANENVYYYDYTPVIDDGSGYVADFANAGDGCHWTSDATVQVVQNIIEWSESTLYGGQ